MDGGSADDARGPVENLMSLITQQNARLREAQVRMGRLRGKGKAADERVTVEVDQFGALVDLKIDPRAMRMGSETLGEAILSAAEQGARDVKAQVDEMVQPLIAELAGTNQRIGAAPAEAEFADQHLDDVLAALRDVRHDLRL
jgi:DNA-binding protein YbaB